MESIRDLIRLSDSLYCSAQPTQAELKSAQQNGIELVINLAMSDSDFALPDEKSVVEALGMTYIHIPVPFPAPQVEHFLLFERTLLEHKGQKTLVHCALNWRGTTFAALYAERRLGWRKEQSDALRGTVWTPNQVWSTLATTVRALPKTPI